MNQRENTLASSATRSGTNVHEVTPDASPFLGATVVVDVTGSSGDGTQDLSLTIRYVDPASGKTVSLITDTFTDGATGTRAYLIYPGVADTQASYSKIEEAPLPPTWEVEADVNQGGSSPDFTYSVGAILHG